MRLSTRSSLVATCAALCVTILLSVGGARGQQSDPLTGKWNMLSIYEGGEYPWTLSIAYADGKYSASSSTEGGDAAVKDLKVEGKAIHFRVAYQGTDYDIDLKLVGEKLAGTWSGNGDSGDTKGEKAPASEHS